MANRPQSSQQRSGSQEPPVRTTPAAPAVPRDDAPAPAEPPAEPPAEQPSEQPPERPPEPPPVAPRVREGHVRLRAASNITAASAGGVEYTVADDGTIEVPIAVAPELEIHGFTRVDGAA